MPRPKTDALRVIYDADGFTTMIKSLRRWARCKVWIEGDSSHERIYARRRVGAELFARELLIAGDIMKVEALRCLRSFVIGDAASAKSHYIGPTGEWLSLDDEVEEIRSLAVERAANRRLRHVADTGLAAGERAERYRGVNDLVAPLYMRAVDAMAQLPMHVANRGKIRNFIDYETRQDLARVAATGKRLRISVAPLTKFGAASDDVESVTTVIRKIEQIRDALLKNWGMDAAALQPGFDAPLPDPAVNSFLPAARIKDKYGIDPSRLRQAKRRGQLPFIVPDGRVHPFYHEPTIVRLWPPISSI